MKLLFFILTLLALAVVYVLYPKALTPTLLSKPKTQIAAEEISIPIPQITITFISETSQVIANETTVQSEPEKTPAQSTESESTTEETTSQSVEETNTELSARENSIQKSTEKITTGNTSCSSPDSTGLAIAFDRELEIFLNNAKATYGSQYSNLQYGISDQTINQHENQGIVSANYQGSVSEIATGDIIQASGGMTVNFSWDGCNWVLVDYTYW
jgi:hypothetical protein